MAKIAIALEKYKGEHASIEHISRDSERLDSNPDWRRVKSRVFNTFSRLGIEDIRIEVSGKKASDVARRVRILMDKLERPSPAQIRKS